MIYEHKTNVTDVWGTPFLLLMRAMQDGFKAPRRPRTWPAGLLDDGRLNVRSGRSFKQLECN